MKSIVKQITLIVFFFFLLISNKAIAQGEFKINVDISDGNFTFLGVNGGTTITVYNQANLTGPPLLTLTGVSSQTAINQADFTDPSVDDVQIWYSNNITVIDFNNNANALEIQSIEAWGTATFSTLNFYGARSMELNATDTPTFGVNANLSGLFRDCFIMTDPGNNIPTWDTSNVRNLNAAFSRANQYNPTNLGNWDVGNVTDFGSIFLNAAIFNDASINNWNIGENTGTALINMNNVFNNANAFDQELSGWERPAGTINASDPGSTMEYVSSMIGMFEDADVFNRDIGTWNVGRVVDFEEMFYGEDAATVFNNGDAPGVLGTGMQNWNIGENVTTGTIDVFRMFRNARSFNQDLSNWADLTRVERFQEMFFDARTFTGVGLANWNISGTNTHNVNFRNMFGNALLFNEPLANWEDAPESTMAYARNMFAMFNNADAFDQTIGNWDVGRVVTFEAMFLNTNTFSDPAPSISNWHISENTGEESITFDRMFQNAVVFNSPLANWQTDLDSTTEHVVNMSLMFAGAVNFDQALGDWNVGRVTQFQGMFDTATVFSDPAPSVNNWHIGENTGTDEINMAEMFELARAFNSPLASWETDPNSTMAFVFTFTRMFNQADAFNQPLGDWNVGRSRSYQFMFSNTDIFDDPAPSIVTWNIGENTGTSNINMQGTFTGSLAFNSPLESWERAPGTIDADDPGSTLAYVNTMQDMFLNNPIFNQPIDNWDVGRVASFHGMFQNADAFNQPLNSWNIAENIATTRTDFMFQTNNAFNQPLDQWDVSKVNRMDQMFNAATSFDQSLATWTPVTSTFFNNMLNNSALSVANYDTTLTSWAQQDLLDNRVLGATNLEFCAAEPFRASLSADQGWTITGDILGCAPGNVSGASTLLYWVSAGAHIGADGDPVDDWRDISGNGRIFNQPTAANQPTFLNNTTDMVNFNPLMQFDGQDDFVEGFDFDTHDLSFPTTPRINLPIVGRTATSELSVTTNPTPPALPVTYTFTANNSAGVTGSTFNGGSTIPGSWRPATEPVSGANTTEYLELDLGEVVPLSTIRTQGERSNAQPTNWVATYTVEVSTDGTTFTQVDGTFTGNTNTQSIVLNELSESVPAQYVRIFPQTWQGYPALNVDLGTNGYNQASTFIVAIEDTRQDNAIQSIKHIDADNRFDISFADATGNSTVVNSFAGDNNVLLSSPAPAISSDPILLNYSVSGTGEANLYRNGVQVAVDTSPARYILTGTTYLGGLPTADYFNGKIAEANLFGDVLTQVERERINTYFAIKYNIPILHNFIYEDESGIVQTIWDVTANADYNNDVFGLGADGNQGLNQRVSTSRDNDNVLTVATINDFESLNSDVARASLTGESYVIMGNNDGTTTFSTANSPARFKILNRQWFAQVTGSNQELFFEFDVDNANFDIDEPELTADYFFITDSNNNGSLSDDTPTILTNTSGSLWSTPNAITIADGQLFTMGIAFNSFPGGVGTDLGLWLKADAGVEETGDGTALTGWIDSSISINDQASASGSPTFISTSEALNFNPTIRFDGDDAIQTTNTAVFGDNGVYTKFTIVRPNVTNLTANIFSSSDGNGHALFNNNGTLNGWHNGNIFITSTTTFEADEVYLTTNRYTNGGTDLNTIGVNGLVEDSNTTVANYIDTGVLQIGANSTPPGFFYEGEISETIAYSGVLSNNNIQRVESYLAIKYGITLDQSLADGTGIGDYLLSDGSVVYEAHDGTAANPYNNDIFGIVSDDLSALNQQISKSVNAGTILTLSTDADFTTLNGTHDPLTDGQALVIANDGASGDPTAAITTDLETTSYFERSAREWRAFNTGTVGEVNLQFDGYDDTWVLLTRTVDGDFSATTGTTETPLLTAGTVVATLVDGTYFTLARKVTNIEFEVATTSDLEATGGNLPSLLIDGTLVEDTEIDIVVNAISSATAGTDYIFSGASGDAASTVTATIPAGSYTAATPLPLASIISTDITYVYPSQVNPPGTNFPQETFVAPATGDYEVVHAAEAIANGNGWLNIGTTVGTDNTGSNDVLDAFDVADRLNTGQLSNTYTISLVAGTTYYVTSGAGGNSNLTNVSVAISSLDDISIIDDTVVETAETISLSLANAQAGFVIAEVTGGALIDTHVYTITDDDTATVTITADTDADETTASRAFTLTMSAIASTDVDVSYVLTGTAVNPADYADASTVAGTVTIPAGMTTATIDLTVVDDTNIEITETVIATLTAATNNTSVTADTTAATLNILDADTAAATISIGSPVDGTEGTSDVSYTVSLDNNLSNNTGTAITGTVALTGTATNGTDYTDVTTFAIADGASSTTVTVNVTDDSEVEVSETVIATISAPSVGTINTSSVTANIIDDDATALTISIASPVDATEGTSNISYTVSLDNGVTNNTGTAITGTLTLTGTATNGTDYTDVTSFSIADGASSTTVTVNVTDDSEVEVSETVIATISAPSIGAISTSASATANITDDDATALTISIASPVDATEGTSDVSYTVSLDGGVTNNTGTAITGTLALTGTATNGTDYTDVTTFAIADGASSTTVTVNVTDDSEVEVSETVIATISVPSVGTVNTTASSATATIIDDDTATISIAADANTDESISSRVFNVSMSQIVDTNVEVNYILTGSALNGTDYIDNSPVTGTITIPAGSVVASIDLTVIDDNIVEGDETIIATLTALTNNIDVTANTTPAILNIIDDDQINVSVIEDTDNTESVENREFLVAINNAADVDIVLAYTFSGTATISDDYIDINNGSVTIPAGATVESINLSIINDKDAEEDEQITISLSSQMSGINFDNTSATMTVIDDDSCTIPVEAMVSDIQITSVDLDWSMPNSVFVEGFQWNIFEAGDDPIVATAVVSGMTASGETKVNDAGVLIKDTAYDFYVRAICSDTSMSPYSTPIAFVTLADNDDDGIPDDTDSDDDNDGIPDEEDGEPFTPYDPNGDDDGDGILNDTEDTDRDGNPYNDDCDNDGTPNILDTDSCGVIAAEGFTPNGDGINDTWVVRGLNSSPNNIVNVYNRRGHQVFSARDYQSDWGGFYKQNTTRLPPGSYFYSIELGDGSPPIQGWLFINY